MGKWRYSVPMPTPASLAIASRVTSGPSWENARTAASSSRARLRWASARIGRSMVSATALSTLSGSSGGRQFAKRRKLRLGWKS